MQDCVHAQVSPLEEGSFSFPRRARLQLQDGREHARAICTPHQAHLALTAAKCQLMTSQHCAAAHMAPKQQAHSL